MSEEILEKSAEAGAFASGGIGGVSDPSAGVLGNVPGGLSGVTTGPNAVNPTGAPGGILQPEQSRRFIDYIWDATVLANDGRRVTMRANTMELNKVNVGERVIRAAKQADGAYTNANAVFTKIELTTTKIRLDWEVATESLEDNIEGAALEDHLVRLMTNAFANDLEDLAINGNGSTAPFLSIMNGFVNQVTSGSDAHEAVVTVSNNEWTPEVLEKVIHALPRKYRALKTGLKFYASTDTFAGIVKHNGTLADSIYTDTYRNTWLDGNDQTLGGARQTRALGITVMEVPYFPDDYVELTFPQNRVWGFQRDVEMFREFKPKKDTVEYTVYVRFGIAWEELDAVAFADSAANPY
jgi:HK97 family phage major capsid protein